MNRILFGLVFVLVFVGLLVFAGSVVFAQDDICGDSVCAGEDRSSCSVDCGSEIGRISIDREEVEGLVLVYLTGRFTDEGPVLHVVLPDGEEQVFPYRQARGDFDISVNCDVVDVMFLGEDSEIVVNGGTIITDNEWGDSDPAWSPDGTQIAFVSYIDEVDSTNLFVINSDGTGGLRELTTSPAWDHQPEWSPDGTQIAFRRYEWDSGSSEIYFSDDSTGRVTLLVSNGSTNSSPAWSPDGNQVAFVSNLLGNWEIYTISVEGEMSQLTDSKRGLSSVSPVWVGDSIYFHRHGFDHDRNVFVSNVFVMDTDGSNIQQVTADRYVYAFDVAYCQ